MQPPQCQAKKFKSQKRFLNILVLDDDIPQSVLCSVRDNQEIELDMPQKFHKALESVPNNDATLFRCQLSKTNVTKHVIDTGDATPVKVPPHPISFHYSEQAQRQLKDVAEEELLDLATAPDVLQLSTCISQKVMKK